MVDLMICRDCKVGCIIFICLQVLNVLDYDMVLVIYVVLVDWCDDDVVVLVIIDVEGDCVFCVGGDIVVVYCVGLVGDYQVGCDFFCDEYWMNVCIVDYFKLVVVFMQGFVMGGGVGVGGYVSYWIVGDSMQVVMFEIGIGLIFDVGGSWFLGYVLGWLGEYLGLIGG